MYDVTSKGAQVCFPFTASLLVIDWNSVLFWLGLLGPPLDYSDPPGAPVISCRLETQVSVKRKKSE